MDLAARRREFWALEKRVNGHRLAYLDSAATTLVPRVVIEAVTEALATMGNAGRGVHAMAQAANDAIDRARFTVSSALTAWPIDPPLDKPSRPGLSADEIVFTSSTTASVNLVADAWGHLAVREGDVVIASEAEHHSNLLPWQRLCRDQEARFVLARVDDAGRFDLGAFEAQVKEYGERVKLVAIGHVSNVLGTVAPIADIARIAHSVGALVFVDGAQAMPHLDVDVRELACDFYAFSGHKVYAMQGAGVLWGRRELLQEMPWWQIGGGTVTTVEPDHAVWREIPARFEAGTPNTPALVALSTALEWAHRVPVRADEARAHEALRSVIRDAGARVIGEPEVGVVSFAWDYHPHDIASIADGEGVALRSGHHCAQLVHRRFGVDASTRASVGMYTNLDDVEQLGRALAKVRKVLGPR
ncbi:MAG: aminotransferase class V-fold PLP-dependent enzyme [Kofleriaceae bacterium]